MKIENFLNKRGTRTKHYLLGALIGGALSLAGATYAQQIRTTVDGNAVNFVDAQPIMIDGRVLVPVRGVFEYLNATVVWDESSRTVIADRGADNIRLPINSYFATVNGRQVRMDSPAKIYRGSTMVPLRFLSETLGANVEWINATRTVEINTSNSNATAPIASGSSMVRMDAGTVIPFRLNQQLSSNKSAAGDRFTANLDTNGSSNYQGMASGAVLEGHVDVARAKDGDTPGVLGLLFDRVRMADGQTYPVHGSLIGLDSKSVDNDNGRLTAKSGSKSDNLKYVGYGAGGGALVAILTNGNILTNSLIGGALGYLFGEIQKNPQKSHDVTSEVGTKFGVKLNQDLSFQVASPLKK